MRKLSNRAARARNLARSKTLWSLLKDIYGSLKESFVNDKIIEMIDNEFIYYQSHMIGHVESVTIEKARECVGEDPEQSNTTLRRSRRARKRANFDEFMYYDD